MNKIKLIKSTLIFTVIGCIQFLILTSLAMIFYPGGTRDNYYETKYNFLENFFSDLGRVETFLGESNIISHSLFTTALTIVGLALIAYFIIFPFFIKENKAAKWLSIIGSINGIVSGINYIGIGFAPYDIRPEIGALHTNFVYIAFTSSILTILLYTIAIFLEREYPNVYSWIFIIFGIILVGYLIILYAGPSTSNYTGLLINVVGQKIIIYSEIIFFGIQSVGSILLLKKGYFSNNTNVTNQKFKEVENSNKIKNNI
ncbi:MAG TPA: DUF998 domain-containing protein [candidate division Zixibacteria bacterium]|nr:DUF998 domain-containing protein [candidate division Zixibacteria bacterium]